MTFRNTHNFLDQKKSENIYQSLHNLLKKMEYLELFNIELMNLQHIILKGLCKRIIFDKHIEEQGFKLLEKTELNSNSKISKITSKGVWTYLQGMQKVKNKSVYEAIGESDRMTLKFIKK